MKRTIVLTMFLLMAIGAFAITQPQALDQPPSFGDDDDLTENCEAWDVKEETCIGNVRHYQQCHTTMTGNIWQAHSEICDADNPNLQCLGGKCVKKETIYKSIFYVIGAIAIIYLVFIRRKK